MRILKCDLWRVNYEVRTLKSELWSLNFEVNSELWSLISEHWTKRCEVLSLKWKYWSLNSEVWALKSEFWTLKCELCIMICEVRTMNLDFRISMKCEVWSLNVPTGLAYFIESNRHSFYCLIFSFHNTCSEHTQSAQNKITDLELIYSHLWVDKTYHRNDTQ